MTISFKCPSCAKPYNVPDQLAGKKSKCNCGNQFVIPAAASTPQVTPQTAPMPSPGLPPQSNPNAAVGANPLGGMPAPAAGQTPLGGFPTPPAGANPPGGMPMPPSGANPLGGMPAAPGGNPLGGLPAGTPGMQAGGWNTPAGGAKAKGKKSSGSSKKGLWIGVSIGAVLLIAGGVTAFLMPGGDENAEQASNDGETTAEASQTSTGGSSTQGGPGQGGDMSSMMGNMTDPGSGDPGNMGGGMSGPGMGGDPGNMGEGMMDPGSGEDPSAGGNFGAGPGTDPSLGGGDPAAGGNFGAGPGTDPSLGGGDPAAGGNFGAGPGTDPSLGGGAPAAGGNFGAGPGTDPSAGAGNPFGNGGSNGGGIPNADLPTIRRAIGTNDFEKVSVANMQLLKLMTATLKKIHDPASAIAQMDTLKQLESVFQLSTNTMKKMKKPTQAEKTQLARKFGLAGRDVLTKYNKEVDRVTKIKGLSQDVVLQIKKIMQLSN